MQNILIQYLAWQLIDAPQNILGAWRNCLKFNLNYWSVPLLLRTLLSPWRRYRSAYGRGFAFKRYFEVFTFNMISRIMGAILRSVFIVLGILTEVLVILIGAVVLLGWLALPLVSLYGFYLGFKILF